MLMCCLYVNIWFVIAATLKLVIFRLSYAQIFDQKSGNLVKSLEYCRIKKKIE